MRALLLIAFCLPGFARADSFQLAFPVDCTLGRDCFIQNYVDRDPGPGHQDAACGHLSYNGHTGTDIALYTEAEIARDVAVTAVAPGIVRGTRDGMPDILASAPNAPDVTGRSCGNAVVIDHGDGWQSTYCHLKRSSVSVRSGDVVDTGTRLGAIGLSGGTEFPHLHLGLRLNDQLVDPFRPTDIEGCGTIETTLWADPLPYVPAGFLAAGTADDTPAFAEIEAGTADQPTQLRDAPALVFWAFHFGAKVGDQISFDIQGPRRSFLSHTIEVDRTQVRAFHAAGRRKRGPDWTPGLYTAAIKLIRDGRVIDTIDADLRVE